MITKLNDIMQDWDGPLPVWIRPPKVGLEFFTGLSRSKLYSLAEEGKIKTRSLRAPGQIKGTRLFLLKSILDHIESSEAGESVGRLEDELERRTS